MKKILLTLVLTIAFIFTGITGSYAADYDTLPFGKNYIDMDNISLTQSGFVMDSSITVKANTDYTLTLPFAYATDYFNTDLESLDFTFNGNGVNFFTPSVLNTSNWDTYLTDTGSYTVWFTFNTGSATTIEAMDFILSQGAQAYEYALNNGGYFQLEEGTTRTTYEEFIRVQQTSYSKNIYNKNITPQALGYLLDTSDGTWLSTSIYFDVSHLIPVDSSTEYIVSGYGGGGAPMIEYDANGDYVQGANISYDSWTTSPTTAYIRISWIYADVKDTLQIEEGSVATSYVEYKELPAVSALSYTANIFDYNSGNYLYGIYLDGTGSEISNETYDSIDWFIPVDSSTNYAFSSTGSNVNAVYWLEYDSNFEFIQQVALISSFTSSSTTSYIKISASNLADVNTTTQIEKGTVATSYVAYSDIASDDTAPVITLNGSSTINVEIGNTYTEFGATALDDVDGNISVVTSGTVDTNTIGTYTITYAATDAAGNEATETRTVNVEDTTGPVISGASGVYSTSYDDPITAAELHTLLIATDAADGNVSVTIFSDNYTGNEAILGDYDVTFRSEDLSGNISEIIITIRVNDDTGAVLTITGDNPYTMTVGDVFIDQGCTYIDNVDGSGACSVDSNNIDPDVAGTYQVVYRYDDLAGNNSTGEFTRTVIVEEYVDTEGAVLTILGANPFTILVGEAFIDPGCTWIDNVDGNGICGIQSNNINQNVPGTYQIVYRYDDVAGNNSTGEFTRTVIVEADEVGAVLTILGANPYTMTVGDAFIDPGCTWIDNVDGDGICGIQSNNIDPDTIGTYQVVYRYDDVAGNNSTGEFTRTVIVEPEPIVVPIIPADNNTTEIIVVASIAIVGIIGYFFFRKK